MNFTKLTFRTSETVDRAFADAFSALSVIGAYHIDSPESKLLRLRGLIEFAAVSLRTPDAVARFAEEVKARQRALQAAGGGGPYKDTLNAGGRNSSDAGRVSVRL